MAPRFRLFPTAIGECGIAWRGDAVVATSLPGRSPEATAAYIARRVDAVPGVPPQAVVAAMASIAALLDGAGTDLGGIAIDLDGVGPFAARVYTAVRGIPAGGTDTYGGIATLLGDRSLARDVGRALGRNPLPIIVPCHRIVGAGGRLVGFSADGGIALKLRMLAIEGARLGGGSGLFADLPLEMRAGA